MSHFPPDLVSEGMSLVHVEADPFPQDKVHGRGVGQPHNRLDDEVRALIG